MAINTLTNPAALDVGCTHYSQRVLEGLNDILVPLDGFATDFSPEMLAGPGDEVQVPYVDGDEVGDYDDDSNNFGTVPSTALKTSTVKLGLHKIVKFAVTPLMAAKYMPQHWDKKADKDVNKIAAAIQSAVFDLPISDKVTQRAVISSGDMTFEKVVEIAEKIYALNIEAKTANLYLTPTHYFALKKTLTYSLTGNPNVINASDLGGTNIGFPHIYCLPPNASTSFVAKPDLVMLASRPYLGAEQGPRGDIVRENLVTDANSGLTLVQTVVSNSNTKTLVHNLDVWFGAEIGNPSAGAIVEAETAA